MNKRGQKMKAKGFDKVTKFELKGRSGEAIPEPTPELVQ